MSRAEPCSVAGYAADQNELHLGAAERFDQRAEIGPGSCGYFALPPARRSSAAKRASSWS